jgi:hypothetical protein
MTMIHVTTGVLFSANMALGSLLTMGGAGGGGGCYKWIPLNSAPHTRYRGINTRSNLPCRPNSFALGAMFTVAVLVVCVCGGGGAGWGGGWGGGEGRGRLLQANTSPLNGTLHKRQHGMVLECKRLPPRA